MKTKAEKLARKEAKVAEWLGAFRRAYEMSRAYGKDIEKSTWAAVKETNAAIKKDWDAVPQDRGFFIDCKMMVMDRLKDTIIDEEKKAPTKNKRKPAAAQVEEGAVHA